MNARNESPQSIQKKIFLPLELILPQSEKLSKALDQFEFNLLNPKLSIEKFKDTEKILARLQNEIKKGKDRLDNSLSLLKQEKYQSL